MILKIKKTKKSEIKSSFKNGDNIPIDFDPMTEPFVKKLEDTIETTRTIARSFSITIEEKELVAIKKNCEFIMGKMDDFETYYFFKKIIPSIHGLDVSIAMNSGKEEEIIVGIIEK